MLTRRDLAKGLAASSLLRLPNSYALGAELLYQAATDDCGVTSGSPTPNGFVVWTRVPLAFQNEIAKGEDLVVRYEVASREQFDAASIVAYGDVTTSSARDFTVKIKIGGLSPSCFYYYRFTTESGYRSVVGRARTAPGENDAVSSLRFAAVSCQSFSAGYYSAYLSMAKEQIDFAIHLGDHIYERDSGRRNSPDPLGGRTAESLADYRKKHRYYLSDPAWREARRLFTWIDIWDDHEVFNDWSSDDVARDPRRFSAAYQAFAEYMPIADELANDGAPSLQLYRTLRFGKLVDLFAIDQRQYRDSMPCDDDFITEVCSEARSSQHTMLGTTQKAWLKEQLGSSETRWRLLMSEVMMSPFFVPAPRGGHEPLGKWQRETARYVLNLDAWDGFPSERRELTQFMAQENLKNIVVVTGDIHSAYDVNLHQNPEDARSPVVATEVVTSAISSWPLAGSLRSNLGSDYARMVQQHNPHFQWADYESNGYTILEFSFEEVKVTHVGVESTATPESPARITRTMRIAAH